MDLSFFVSIFGDNGLVQNSRSNIGLDLAFLVRLTWMTGNPASSRFRIASILASIASSPIGYIPNNAIQWANSEVVTRALNSATVFPKATANLYSKARKGSPLSFFPHSRHPPR